MFFLLKLLVLWLPAMLKRHKNCVQNLGMDMLRDCDELHNNYDYQRYKVYTNYQYFTELDISRVQIPWYSQPKLGKQSDSQKTAVMLPQSTRKTSRRMN